MNGTTGEQRSPGVYDVDRDGREQQVHPYQGGPYTLSDVVHLFDLGRLGESGRGNETVACVDRRGDAHAQDHGRCLQLRL